MNRRIHHVKTYPVLSPQGSTILIYGHENGVTLVWRGGRRLKPAKPDPPAQAAKSKQNGAEDAVMIIDSSDDEAPPPAKPFVDKPEFEDDPVEKTSEYPDIIQTLDLAMGTDVYHIAVLPMAPCAAEDAARGGTDALTEKMVFAVSSAKNDVYVISLPLTPPSHESKAREELRSDLLAGSAGKGKWGEAVRTLSGQGRITDGIAMSLVKPGPGSGTSATRVIVAAHSREASGTLRFWDVPIGRSAETLPIQPFQTEYLPSPLTGIAFNPTNPTQLLAIASPTAVRVFDFKESCIPDDNPEGPWPSQGSWLLSLYPPFARGTSSSAARKPIVAANWISHGKAILTLLADGQWGIWDVEGAGPSGNNESGKLFGRHNSGVRGAALSTFIASGQLEGTSSLRNPASQRSSAAASGELAPMTPHSRRENLLSTLSGGPERLAAVRGGIEVIELPAIRGATTGDESAILWVGGADNIVCVIPAVSKFWDAQIRRSAGGGVNLFSGAQPTRMVRLTELHAGLLGEKCNGVSAVARFQRHTPDADGEGGSAGLPIEVLVRGESRLVVVHESQDFETAPIRFPTRKLKRLAPANEPSEPVTAIVVHPRHDRPAVNFDLTLRPATRGSARSAPSVNLFNKSIQPSVEMDLDNAIEPQPAILPARPRNMGLDFVDALDAAADASYEVDAEERNTQQEVKDLMEIDQALEQMQGERNSGTKRVFFEED